MNTLPNKVTIRYEEQIKAFLNKQKLRSSSPLDML